VSDAHPAGEPDVRLKRAYDRAEPGDGYRVLVDRLWRAGLVDPDAQVSESFEAGIPPGAVASQKFDTRPDDVAALVASVKTRS
jgi:uncharacterized protein YeaO (DUF488 family)